MPGRPSRKIYCQSLRRDGYPCQAKGFLCKNGKYFCRFHGYNNILGFRKPNYTDDTRKRQLRKLQQFRNYTEEQFEKYYREKVKRRIESGSKSKYHTRQLNRRKHTDALYRIQNNKSIGDQLIQVLQHIKKKSST